MKRTQQIGRTIGAAVVTAGLLAGWLAPGPAEALCLGGCKRQNKQTSTHSSVNNIDNRNAVGGNKTEATATFNKALESVSTGSTPAVAGEKWFDRVDFGSVNVNVKGDSSGPINALKADQLNITNIGGTNAIMMGDVGHRQSIGTEGNAQSLNATPTTTSKNSATSAQNDQDTVPIANTTAGVDPAKKDEPAKKDDGKK